MRLLCGRVYRRGLIVRGRTGGKDDDDDDIRACLIHSPRARGSTRGAERNISPRACWPAPRRPSSPRVEQYRENRAVLCIIRICIYFVLRIVFCIISKCHEWKIQRKSSCIIVLIRIICIIVLVRIMYCRSLIVRSAARPESARNSGQKSARNRDAVGWTGVRAA